MQFVKTSNNCSTLLCTNAGSPQGTLVGLLITCMSFDLPFIKYLSLHAVVNHLDWTHKYSIIVNEQKPRNQVMLFNFSITGDTNDVLQIIFHSKDIKHFESFKFFQS
jgi:hypothetical protein